MLGNSKSRHKITLEISDSMSRWDLMIRPRINILPDMFI